MGDGLLSRSQRLLKLTKRRGQIPQRPGMAKSAGNMATGTGSSERARYGWAGRLRPASQRAPDTAHAAGSGKYQKANIPLLRVPVLGL